MDALQALQFREVSRVHSARRAVSDLAELAYAQGRLNWRTGVAPVPAAPLVGELAALYGWPAACLPLVQSAILRSVARATHRDFSISSQLPQIAALVGGLGIREFETERALQLRRDLNRTRDKERTTLRLHGIHEVVTFPYKRRGNGWETPHDTITNLQHLLRELDVDPTSELAIVLSGRKSDVHDKVTVDRVQDIWHAIRTIADELKSLFGAKNLLIANVTPNDVPMATASRVDDYSPWDGGDAITSEGIGCTAAVGINYQGSQYMLTAAHCYEPGWPVYNEMRGVSRSNNFMGSEASRDVARCSGTSGPAST
jgi:hypothetical protein